MPTPGDVGLLGSLKAASGFPTNGLSQFGHKLVLSCKQHYKPNPSAKLPPKHSQLKVVPAPLANY